MSKLYRPPTYHGGNMKEFFAFITALSAAIGSISSCSDKAQRTPSGPPASQQQSTTVTITPSQNLATEASNAKESPNNAESPAPQRPSMSVVSSSFPSIAMDKYLELKALNAAPVVGDSGEAAENRLIHAYRKLELASFLAENAHLLKQLTGANSDYVGAIEEADRLPYYQAEAARLESAWKR